MGLGLFIFTLLWVVSCCALYGLLKHKVEQQTERAEEAIRLHKIAQDHYNKAIDANNESRKLNDQLKLRWKQIEHGLNCPN